MLHISPAAAGARTHASVVRPWECDEKAHLSARFYADRFQQAAGRFAVVRGWRPLRGTTRLLSLRFHREVTVDESVTIDSFCGRDVAGPFVAHRMTDSAGRLSATALDRTPLDEADPDVGNAPTGIDLKVFGALPLPACEEARSNMQAALGSGGILSGGGSVGPGDVGADGSCLDRVHVGWFSDGAAMMWNALGLGPEVLAERNWGGMVGSMTMRLSGSVGRGRELAQVSRVVGSRSRTVAMTHDQFDVTTGVPVAHADAIGMLVDLDSRRIIELSANVRASVAR